MKQGRFCHIDINSEEDCVKLSRIIARGEPLTLQSDTTAPLRYKPLYKHPLPLSETRHVREGNLRRIMATRLAAQASGAVALRDAWVLEAVYLRGTVFTCLSLHHILISMIQELL
jgi:hypothetical protein